MKNTTKIFAIVWVVAVILIWSISIYWMWILQNNFFWNNSGLRQFYENNQIQGQGRMQWRWQRQWNWKNFNQEWNSWSFNRWQMQVRMQWNWQRIHSWIYSNIDNIPKSDLSEQEKKDLVYQYNEEKVARDIYTYFNTKYWVKQFANIAESEQQHMDSVKILLDRYFIEVPTSFWELQTTYDTLKSEWEKSLKSALEVWLKIEMLDIKDIVDTIKTTDNDDLKIVFTNIWWASYNHIRWFLNALDNNWFTTTLDYSQYLTKDELNTKWSLQNKLVEKLTSEWVTLPNQVK